MEVSTHNTATKNLAKKRGPPPQKRIQHGLWVLPGFCCFFAVYIHTYIQPAYSNSFFLLSTFSPYNPHCLDAALPPGAVYYSTE